MLSFFSFKLHTFTYKVNGSSAYYKVVFLVLLFISWSVVSCPPGIYLSCYLCCLALWQALSRRRSAPAPVKPAPASIRRRSQRTAAAPVRGRRRLQSGRRAVDTTLLRYSSYCFQLLQLPSYATLKYAIVSYSILGRSEQEGGLATNFGGAHVECHCWVPLGCHCLGAIARCHCWVPLLGDIVRAMAGCHCSVPLPDASYQL